MAEHARKKKPKWYINDRRVRRLLLINHLSLARFESSFLFLLSFLHLSLSLFRDFDFSEKQAQEDETTEDFTLTPQDLSKNPTDIFELLEQRGKGFLLLVLFNFKRTLLNPFHS